MRFGNFESIGGYLRPGIRKVDRIVPVPIPEKAKVVWKSSDGMAHEEKVDVKSTLPEGFRGEVIFTIREDGKVSVTHKPFFKMPQNWNVVPR